LCRPILCGFIQAMGQLGRTTVRSYSTINNIE